MTVHVKGAPAPPQSNFGTKAETLARLRPLVRQCKILDLYHFSVSEWQANAVAVLQAVRSSVGGGRLVIRSSALIEDTSALSMAGAFRTWLDVDGDSDALLTAAIDDVIASYLPASPLDQVLVQPMLSSVRMSGVIMTRDLTTGGPYYVINYDDESGRTDRITGGQGVNKTVVVHRNFHPSFIESPRIAELLCMTRELETLTGSNTPLDIEFARTADDVLYALQVRPITVRQNWHFDIDTRVSDTIIQAEEFFHSRSQARPGLAGSRTILGQMPDWNPAEMIGTHPRPLAVSLYRTLITDSVWREARAAMGYREVGQESLMVTLAGHPYIDVRNSFNSFLPAGLDTVTAGMIVDAWLHRLATHPEWHDKVEFEIAQTVLDFSFDEVFAARYGGLLSTRQLQLYKRTLQQTTQSIVNLAPGATLMSALGKMAHLEGIQESRGTAHVAASDHLVWVNRLLYECRELGTLPFAAVARHAFAAEALLRSAVSRGALSSVRCEEFKRSVVTVAGQFAHSFDAVLRGNTDSKAFLRRYGHLRPGTYDIRSQRYDQRSDLLSGAPNSNRERTVESFALTDAEQADIENLLRDTRLAITAVDLMHYARLAIAGREECKFIFTRHISDILEILAAWGDTLGLSRDDVSFLSVHRILEQLHQCGPPASRSGLLETVRARRHEAEVTSGLRLFYLIRDIRDIHVAPLHRSAPTFVTSHRVEGAVSLVDTTVVGGLDLAARIVCIENADPGYDWIFTRGICGLVTKFGGANSHMAIRCAEIGLPASIGVGEQTFDRLVACGLIELDCGSKIVRPLHA